MIILDMETRSRCNLLTAGAWNYAIDPSTDIICAAFYDLETESRWLWYAGDEVPENLKYRLVHTDLVAAHNAEFDMGIYEAVATEYGFPMLPRAKWYCTSAQARVNNLPPSLDDAAWAIGLKTRKMASGKHLIRKLSIPQKDGTFNKDPELIKQMGEYCMQDVIVTVNLYRSTRPMMQQEHQDWLKTVEVNDRGVKIDRVLAECAMRYADDEKEAIADKLATLTDGYITSHTQTARIRDWVLENTGDDVRRMMTVHKNGEEKLSLDKAVRRNLLNDDSLDPLVREVVELLDDGNKSSVAKFKRMINLSDPEDDRVRGAFMFAGATQTLRYTSRGLQLHNMRRDCFDGEEAEEIKAAMYDEQELEGSVMDVLGKMLRPAIIPETSNVLIVGDWSSIEARVLPWLSDTSEGDRKLKLFESGSDVYVATALRMGLTEDDRQIGKVAELACGYQGGVNAFQNMAKIYGLNIPEDTAQLYVDKWRRANPWAVTFWNELAQAAMCAVGTPRSTVSAGMVDYRFEPDLMGGTLLCIMPNDTVIQYPKVRVEEGRYGWELTALKASFKPKADDKEWPRTKLYGGLLAENCTQAFSAAILRNALRQLDDVIASVHDEIVLEVPIKYASEAKANLEQIMCAELPWADGLPLIAKPTIMTRYGK